MNTTESIVPLPHAPGVEKDVLSVIFQDPRMFDDAPQLTSKCFHIPAHQIVFDLIRELHAAGKPVEIASFMQMLNDRGLFDRVGGPSAIADFQTRAILQPEIFSRHIEILTEKLARRMTITAAEEMARCAYEEPEPSEIISATSSPITAIHDLLAGTSPAANTQTILRACFDHFERLCKGLETPMGIETSLAEINMRFRGIHPRQTIVISAYPGGGKTTLAGQLAMDACLSGRNALFVSLEMPCQSLMDRMLAYTAKRPAGAITDPLKYCREVLGTNGPTNDMLAAISKAARKIAEAPFHIEDLNGANVYQIAACIRRSHRKRPLEVVVVDYAQRIRSAPEKIRETREQQLAHASNHLADLSKELGFCLLLPSQLNKDGAAKHAEAINEDADLHLQIVQDRSGSSPTYEHRGIAVVKDRHHGQDGTLLPIALDGPMIRFIPKPFSK